MRFMMLMIPAATRRRRRAPCPRRRRVAAMMKYNEALKDAGVLITLDGLHPPSMGARVSFAGGKPVVTDGPFTESKEVLGGYWMIEVEIARGGDRLGEEVPGLRQRGHRDPPGAGNGGFSRRCSGSRRPDLPN